MNDPNYDPLEEIQRIKDEIAAEHNYDIDSSFREIFEMQRTSGRIYHELHKDGSRTLHQYGKPIAFVPAGIDYKNVLANLAVSK